MPPHRKARGQRQPEGISGWDIARQRDIEEDHDLITGAMIDPGVMTKKCAPSSSGWLQTAENKPMVAIALVTD
ncbi:MAG: hypothetical protein O2967_23095 [Proteobacteria bacterium]|nr:hypothetical protein [Pseudomonadota bacterium]